MGVVIVGSYLYSRYNPEDYRFFPKCPVYLLSGYMCPGCGSQRALYHLFHGHIATAFKYNPLVMLLIPYILSGIYFEYIANKSRPRIRRLRDRLFGKWAFIILLVLIAFFTFIRNYSKAGCFFISGTSIS